MIKKYLVDILCALVILAGAFLIAERTGVEIPDRRTPPPKEKRTDLKKEEKKVQASEIIRQTGAAEPLTERNAFGSGEVKTALGAGKAGRRKTGGIPGVRGEDRCACGGKKFDRWSGRHPDR
jgi:hypothetical protein